jgi:hypothetical protein
MPVEISHNINHLLFRRLHRHGQIATLMRADIPELTARMSDQGNMESSPTVRGAPIVQARLSGLNPISPRAEFSGTEAVADNSLDQPSQLHNENIDPTWQRLNSIYQLQRTLVQRELDSPAPSVASTPEQIQPVFYPATTNQQIPPVGEKKEKRYLSEPEVKPEPVTSIPTSKPSLIQPARRDVMDETSHNGSKISDAEWRRLEAIYKAHQEKDKLEQTPIKEPVEEPVVSQTITQLTPSKHPISPIMPNSKHVQEYSSKEAIEAEDNFLAAGLDREPVIQEKQVTQPEQGESQTPSQRQSLERGQEQSNGGSLTEDRSTRLSLIDRSWQSIKNLFVPHQIKEKIQADETPKEEMLAPGQEPEPADHPRAESTVDSGLTRSAEYISPDDAEVEEVKSEISQHPWPLEDAWMVDRLDNQPGEMKSKVGMGIENSPAQPTLLPSEQPTIVQNLMQTLKPHEQTDSKVEVLAPLHPRPTPIPEGSENQGEETIEEQNGDLTPHSIQRQPSIEVTPKQASAPDRVPPNLEPKMVKLWGLLDDMQAHTNESSISKMALSSEPGEQKTGTIQENPPILQQAEKPGHSKDNEIWDEDLGSLPPKGGADEIGSQPVPSIQRQEIAPQNEIQPTSASTGGSESGKMNVDDLARQVYGEVKRRLVSEWERRRY